MTEAMILSKFNDGIVSASQTVQTNSTSCSSLEFQVTFPEAAKQYKLSIFADGPCNNKSISTLTFDLNVIHCFCPPGFMPHDNSINCSCICDQKLSEQIENLECSIADESIIRKGEFWVTFLGNSSSNNTFPSYSYYVYPRCPFDYCKPPSVQTPIKLSDQGGSDAQCVNNRGGLLCGSCQSNYSLSLGSSKCINVLLTGVSMDYQ